MSKRGPIATKQPSRDKYKCPVKNCNSEIRGDDIGKHFQKYSNFIALDKANENQSLLRKRSLQATDVVEISDVCLKDFLVKASDSEKLHTEYLFQHGYSSMNLPDFNSVNFKCQQKSYQLMNYLDSYSKENYLER